MPAKLPPLAFEIFRHLGASLRGQKLLIACSGGLDSVVLVEIFARLAPRLELELAVAHIHHGTSKDKAVQAARDHALAFTEDFARQKGLPFFFQRAPQDLALVSEAELRDFRHRALDEIRAGVGANVSANLARPFDRIAFAHHADDLLETRLMRLIRGTGARGLRSMSEIGGKTVRPFLRVRRQSLLQLAQREGLKWWEDPSNQDAHYFRNWIRTEWLPLLEKKQPGATSALMRSLDLLTETLSEAELRLDPVKNASSGVLKRQEFHRLTTAQKRERVAGMAQSLVQSGVHDFGYSRVSEVLKRLDRLELSRQRHASFKVGGVEWCVTPLEIEALRITDSSGHQPT